MSMAMKRRNWLKTTGFALASGTIGSRVIGADGAGGPLFHAMGIAAPLAQAEVLKGQGRIS